jgi:ferredoxin
MAELANYQRVVIDQDTCISCGACVAACPYQALELDENGKSRLIWEVCAETTSPASPCVPSSAIYKDKRGPSGVQGQEGLV